MLKIFLWLRYLGKIRVVLLSIAAVALSTALLIVVASLFNGFIDAFERSAVDAIGDIVISPPMRFAKYPELIERLEQTSVVEAATATLTAKGLLHLGRGNVRGVDIWGIEPERRERVTGFKRSLLRTKSLPGGPSFETGEAGTTGGFIGIGVVTRPDEETDEYDFESAEKIIGGKVVLTTGTLTGGEGAEGKQFRRKTLEIMVLDVVFTGVYQFDKGYIYLPIERVQEAVYPEAKQPIAGQIQIKLKSGADVEVALAQIRGVWEVFASERLGWPAYVITETAIETSKQIQSQLVAEFRKQMGVLLLIFGVVSLSAVLLVFCIFYMIVERQRRDIAILKSCGAGSGAVAFIFLGFGVFVGALGTLLGTMLGYLVTKNINVVEDWIRIVFGLKLWKASVYMFSKIPNEVDWQAAVWIALSAIAGAAIGAVIPAVSAAITRPVNVLRYE
jgi:lipoprotein-releasing system permease protein